MYFYTDFLRFALMKNSQPESRNFKQNERRGKRIGIFRFEGKDKFFVASVEFVLYFVNGRLVNGVIWKKRCVLSIVVGIKKNTYPKRAVQSGSGVSMLGAKVQLFFETNKYFFEKFLVFGCAFSIFNSQFSILNW